MEIEEIMVAVILSVLVCMTVLAAIAVPTIGISVWFNKGECEAHARQLNTRTEFEFFGGCYVEHDGRMVKIRDYRYIEMKELKQ